MGSRQRKRRGLDSWLYFSTQRYLRTYTAYYYLHITLGVQGNKEWDQVACSPIGPRDTRILIWQGEVAPREFGHEPNVYNLIRLNIEHISKYPSSATQHPPKSLCPPHKRPYLNASPSTTYPCWVWGPPPTNCWTVSVSTLSNRRCTASPTQQTWT